MISSKDFKQLIINFTAYINTLKVTDSYTREHIDLKLRHTYHVISNIMIIAKNIGLPESSIQLAKVIALTHDIGRFQQFISYGTFDDSLSVNHAEYGVRIMAETDFLTGIVEDTDHEIIIQSILNHNIPSVNPRLDEGVLLFSRLIRDADKLDIWDLMTVKDVVYTILDPHASPGDYEVPDPLYDCFRNGQVVPVKFADTMNDYRLLRLSWIYDMNFPATFALIHKRNYVSKILAKIPPSEKIDEISTIIHKYITCHSGLQNKYPLYM